MIQNAIKHNTKKKSRKYFEDKSAERICKKNEKWQIQFAKNGKCVLDFGREELLSQSRCDLVRPPADTAQIRASAKIIIMIFMIFISDDDGVGARPSKTKTAR